MTTQTVVWIVDSQQWPRAYLRAELIERGFEAVGYADLSSAVAALRHPATDRPRVLVLELRELAIEISLLDALMWTGIPVVLLVGAIEANEQVVKDYKWAAVMKRPFSIGAIADEVQKVASQ
jgi:hypothetical protein